VGGAVGRLRALHEWKMENSKWKIPAERGTRARAPQFLIPNFTFKIIFCSWQRTEGGGKERSEVRGNRLEGNENLCQVSR